MVWECECPLGGCTDKLTKFLRSLAEPWAVQAVREETHGAVVEPDTGCSSGHRAAATALGCSAETALWHWCSKLDGRWLFPPSAACPPAQPVDTLCHRHQQETWQVSWWLPSLGRVLQHPRVSRAGWDGTGASGLAGNHRKHCTTEFLFTRTKGSLGVKITGKTEPKPCHGVPQLLRQPKVPPFRPACTVHCFLCTHKQDDITRTTGTILGTLGGLYCPAQACFLKAVFAISKSRALCFSFAKGVILH